MMTTKRRDAVAQRIAGAAEGLFLRRVPANFLTFAIAPVCASNDNVDLNFLTARYRPREFVQCLPWNFASLPGAVQSLVVVAVAGRHWKRERRRR